MDTNLRIPCLQGMPDEALQAKLNDRFGEDALALEKTLQADVEQYVADAQAFDFPIHNFVLYSRYQPGYLNQRLLSLTIDYYQYTGGAHGITERRSYNIDLHSGQDLALPDLSSTTNDYASVINQEIKKQISNGEPIYFEGDMDFRGTVKHRLFICRMMP
jgi:hypothetical protein